MSTIKVISEEEFKDILRTTQTPVVIDFSATWCGPCKMLEPVVEQLADEWEGKAQVYKIDIDQTPSVPQQFGVMGVPTLMLFKNNEVKSQIVGFKPKKKIAKEFESFF